MKHVKKMAAALALGAMLLSHLGAAYAQLPPDQVVRVGFPIQAGISYIDENGDYAGYMVDYLNQMTLFTDWKIEYVQAEGDLNTQLSTLLEQLENGEIDMMGTMNRNEALEETYLYPSYSYGATYTALVVRDDSSYIAENFSSWDGITVATYPGMTGRMKLLEQYAEVNGFTYQEIHYETHEETLDAVLEGEADAVLRVDISMGDGLRSIGRFSPMPYYFALSPNRADLLPELNAALEIMSTSYENLQHELYERHFLNTSDYFRASEEELEYVRSLGTLRVLFLEGNAPFQYRKDGQLKGFSVEYFESLAESIGLQYETVIEDDPEEAAELIKNNQIDLIACVGTDSALSRENGIRLSLPYFQSYAVRTYSRQYKDTGEQIQAFDRSIEDILSDLLSHHEYCAWVDGYGLDYYLRKEVVYDDLVIDWADTRDFSYAVAVRNTLPNASKMVSILNQFASFVSDQDRQVRLSTYLLDEIDYTPWEWILANRMAIIFSVAMVILMVCAFSFYLYHKKMVYKTLINENKLLHLSIYDELTGAYNRTYFCKLLEQKMEECEPWTLVAFNIYNFKYINDTYGTNRANQLLCEIKNILQSDMKEGELICRPSADCFYLAISNQLPEEISYRVHRLQSQLKVMADDLLDGYRLFTYCGAISSTDSPDLFSTQANLNCLTVALMHAKQTGGSEVCMYDESMHKEEQLRQYIEANMNRALEEEEYQVYLQPKMNLRTGQIDSAEALVRWETKDRGMIFPDQFIPLFEQNGFCKRLDLYMLERACQILRGWMDEGIPPITISVNQTKALFVSDDYVEKLLEITSRCRVPPRYIVLEILEGLAFENITEMNHLIARLNEVGFHVSMDDFGSGYSSLNTLGKLNINQIKLDRMFLMDLREEERNSQYEVMRLIFAMAEKLGIETVTEGVETEMDESLITSMECDYGQGYYYSKPIPAADFCNTYLKQK